MLNAGVTGYQPWHYYTWWQQYGRVLRPDLVLLAYYLGNDLPSGGSFTDSESTTDALSEEGPGTPRARRHPRSSVSQGVSDTDAASVRSPA